MNRFGAGLLLAFALACGGEDSSSIIAELRTDLVPGIEFDAFELIDGERALEREVGSDEIGGDWTASRPMGELETEPGTRRMRVRLRRAGTEIIGRDLTVVVEGRTGVQVILTRDCTAVSCAEGEACFAGQCVPDGCISGLEPSCEFTPECATDSECIASNMCAPLVCEPPGYCFPARFECPDQQYCDETTGCTPIPGLSDAGIPDAGFDAGTSDAGTSDAGTSDAGTSDAGTSDAGTSDAGGLPTEQTLGIAIGGILDLAVGARDSGPCVGVAHTGGTLDFPTESGGSAFRSTYPGGATFVCFQEGPTLMPETNVHHEEDVAGALTMDCAQTLCGYAYQLTDGAIYGYFGPRSSSNELDTAFVGPVGLVEEAPALVRLGYGHSTMLNGLFAIEDYPGGAGVQIRLGRAGPFDVATGGGEAVIGAVFSQPFGLGGMSPNPPSGAAPEDLIMGIAVGSPTMGTPLALFGLDDPGAIGLSGVGVGGGSFPPVLAVLQVFSDTTLRAPSGSAPDDIAVSGGEVLLVGLNASGALTQVWRGPGDTGATGVSVHVFEEGDPMVRVALTRTAELGEELVFGRTLGGALFLEEGSVLAGTIDGVAFVDAAEAYVVGRDLREVDGVPTGMPAGSAAFLLRHEVSR